MKFILDNWELVLVALASGALLLWPAIRGAGGGLGAAAAVQLINRERAVVIDVSEPSEFELGHVGGAKHIPVGELEERLPEVVKNKSLPVILVCPNGARSKRAEGIARGLGYQHAQALAGGMRSWREANLPVAKAA